MRKARVCLGACLLVSFALNPLSAQVTQGASETKGLGKADQEKKNDEVIELSPYVVSSTADDGYASRQTLVGGRTASNLLEISTGVQIINQELINDLGAVTMMDALRFGAAGVSFNQKSTEDQSIRGFRSTQSMRNGRALFNFRAQPMYDVERLEVIKGPTAMLMGTTRDANLGGVVNAVTKLPTATRQGDISTSVGSYNDIRVAVNSSGPLLKFKGGDVNYRVTVGGERGDTERDIERIDQRFIGGALKWTFNKNQSLTFVGHVFRDYGYSYFDDFLDISKPVPTEAILNKYSTSSFNVGRRQDGKMEDTEKYLLVTYLAEFGENVSVSANYNWSDNQAFNQLIAGSAILADNYTLTRNVLPQVLEAKVRNFQLDYQHRIKLWNYANLVFNAGLDDTNRSQRNGLSIIAMTPLDTRQPDYSADATLFADPTKFPAPGKYSLTDSWQYPHIMSYFVQPHLKFWKDRIIVMAGKRWTHNVGWGFNNNTSAISRSTMINVSSTKWGAVYRVTPGMSAYYTFAENYIPRTGVLRTPYLAGGDPGELLKDQTGELKEFGVKFDKEVSGKLTVFGTIAYFDQYLTNVITQGIDPASGQGTRPDGVGYRVQSERDRVYGFETGFGARFKTDGGNADLLVNYYNVTPVTATKTQIVGAPKVIYSVLLKYSWTTGLLNGLALGGGAYDESTKMYAGPRTSNVPITYTLFGSYAWAKHWAVSANMNNVTNEYYLLNGSTPGGASASDPMKVRMEMTYKW